VPAAARSTRFGRFFQVFAQFGKFFGKRVPSKRITKGGKATGTIAGAEVLREVIDCLTRPAFDPVSMESFLANVAAAGPSANSRVKVLPCGQILTGSWL
jgi:hypothetical protein